MQPIEPAERLKIAELLKDSTDKDKKVEWIYSGDKIDRDAYLLGKPIDKLLIEKEMNKPKEDIFSDTVDLANKIREDPLFEIKKKEIEAKKRLLENPMRIKQIKAMISQTSNDLSDSENELSDDHRRSRNKREEYRNKRHDRYNDIHYRNRSYPRRSKIDSSSSDDYRKKTVKSPNRSISRSRSRSTSKDHRKHSSSKYGLSKRDYERRPKSEEEEAPKSEKQLEIEEIKRKIERIKQIRASENSKVSLKSHSIQKNISSKLTDEEKQRRLLEMQENAKWRNDVRSNNIKKYRTDAKHEEKLEEENKDKKSQTEASSYFNNMMRDAYSSTEDRIKRNIKNVQRNQSSFEKNFARKY